MESVIWAVLDQLWHLFKISLMGGFAYVTLARKRYLDDLYRAIATVYGVGFVVLLLIYLGIFIARWQMGLSWR